ncbi:hypothetical protein KW797_01750 [Candidatus Parcubacteria bacterium]|nr:hypothetical protein [Candidatus Parcubacteria bacterium]
MDKIIVVALSLLSALVSGCSSLPQPSESDGSALKLVQQQPEEAKLIPPAEQKSFMADGVDPIAAYVAVAQSSIARERPVRQNLQITSFMYRRPYADPLFFRDGPFSSPWSNFGGPIVEPNPLRRWDLQNPTGQVIRFDIGDWDKRNRLYFMYWCCSDHRYASPEAKNKKQANEKNRGGGFEYSYLLTDDDRWVYSYSEVENTVHGQTICTGPGYMRRMVSVWKFDFFAGVNVQACSYEVPNYHGGESIRIMGILPMPSIAIEGPWNLRFQMVQLFPKRIYLSGAAASFTSVQDGVDSTVHAGASITAMIRF